MTDATNTSSSSVVEDRQVLSTEHTMIVNGTQLCERKEVRTVRPAGSDEVVKTEVQHTRTIGDLSFEVVEVRARGGEDRIVNTEMTDSEVEAFQVQWESLWKPDITEDMLEPPADNPFGADDNKPPMVLMADKSQPKGNDISSNVAEASSSTPAVEEGDDDGRSSSTKEVQEGAVPRVQLADGGQRKEATGKKDSIDGTNKKKEEKEDPNSKDKSVIDELKKKKGELKKKNVDSSVDANTLTNMTDEELEEFQKQWKKLWKPVLLVLPKSEEEDKVGLEEGSSPKEDLKKTTARKEDLNYKKESPNVDVQRAAANTGGGAVRPDLGYILEQSLHK